MRHPFTIYDLRFTIWKKSAKSAVANRQSVSRHLSPATRHSPLATRHSQRGVALIITLILLSVVTFMAITFLALSRRERSAVSTVTDTASARLAADAALANAEAQVIANVLSTTNPYNFSLLVSTNYINPLGFNPTLGANLTNVNYYDVNGNFLPSNNIPNFLQLLANLYYSPRPPVFIPNPTNSSLPADFRFYLDLNRNGRYDTNGWVANVDNKNNKLGPDVFQVGDPEWIGVLERPDQPYGPNNPFVARYAFIAVPVGNTLDLNYIYNQAGLPNAGALSQNPVVNHYLRNQGVGSWELNLAAFFYDLNTNVYAWGGSGSYFYDPLVTGTVNGSDFMDALELYRFRLNGLRTGNPAIDYAYNTAVLNSVNNLLGATGDNVFGTDLIDGYSDGPLQTTMSLPADNDASDVNYPWPGADNTNHFFTHQELFNTSETSATFVSRLLAAGNTNSTYDRYTFYRLLSQLGTDSTPESGKMNLNYDNLDPYTNAVAASTNFMAWTPIAFFTNAADRLLRAYTTQWRNSNPTNFATTFYAVTNFSPMVLNPSLWTNYPAFGITNIPVLVNNQFVYSSAANRLLQLAANIYDATTNSFYPSIFRPFFTRDAGGNVFVTGYTNVESVSGMGDPAFSTPFDVSTISTSGGSNVLENVYGVPWIIGAKKGFPNFNKFTMQDVVQITRKLQIARSKIPTTSVSDFLYTNQMYIFNVSNSIGMDCWNSYSNSYPDQVQVVVYDYLSMMLTNDGGAPFVVFNTYPQPYSITTNITYPPWPGSAWNPAVYKGSPAAISFNVPSSTTIQFLTNSVFYSGTTPPGVKGFYPVASNLGWETNNPYFTLPHFGLLMTNRLQVFMLDGTHVIDYAQFAGPNSSRNLNAEFQTNGQASGYTYLWSTNVDVNGVPWGINSQIGVSDGNVALNTTYWSDAEAQDEIDGFASFMGLTMPYTINNNGVVQSYATNYIVQVPYTPTVTAYEYISWQANDPLVHYLASDLNFQGTESGGPTTGISVSTQNTPLPRPSFTLVNDRYQPWGRNSQMANTANVDINPANLAFKDPLVRYSDNWDFPNYKFPTVGWLGRVHRGTPWQTVFLKATNILTESNIGTNTWVQWTGDTQLTYGQYFDAVNSAPVQDRLLFDLFTTAFNDNATRGTLSVNQNHLAAWSALFSGVVVLSNNVPDSIGLRLVPQYQNPPPSFTNNIIGPAGPAWTNSPLGQLVNGINQTRAIFTNADGLVGTFEHVGDILSVPQLTERSPFLNWNDGLQQTNAISDEMYEWLPQQAMSLLRVSGSPRYVIYCYGQALKPAPNGIYTGTTPSGMFGMVTNYQVVSEIATRAVVRFGSMLTNVITTNTFLGINGWVSVPVPTNNNAVIESFNILPPD
jgi:hypothetical protein